MNKDYFMKCLNVIYQEITNNVFPISVNEFNYVKEFVFKNPLDPDVIIFKNWMVNTYQEPFLNPNFIKALNMPDNLKFIKIQEIYKTLPYIFNRTNYPYYFYNLIVSPSEYFGTIPNFYKACYWFFTQENNCLIPESLMNKICDFMSQNSKIISGSKDTYHDYQTELLKYRNIFANIYDEEFVEFKRSQKLYDMYLDDYEITKEYEYKKLGTIGEIYVFDKIKDFLNANFTARDLGNGFGYDMYCQSIENNQIVENLFEVKTTTNLSGNDTIFLSENEYNIMVSTLNTNAHYYVCRVFADINKNENYEVYILQLHEGNILKSINPDAEVIEYYLDKKEGNNYYFKRKQKILELK